MNLTRIQYKYLSRLNDKPKPMWHYVKDVMPCTMAQKLSDMGLVDYKTTKKGPLPSTIMLTRNGVLLLSKFCESCGATAGFETLHRGWPECLSCGMV